MSKKCAHSCCAQNQNKTLLEKIDLILTKLEKLEKLDLIESIASSQSLQSLQSLQLVRQPSDYPVEQQQKNNEIVEKKETENFINEFFTGKEQFIKDEVREFMLKNFNIKQLDDKVEGDIYDYIVDKIWDLTVGKFL